MKITALLENTPHRNGMQTEHGLSLYIETGTHTILFDMGQTDLFCHNAKNLGIDLGQVDLAVLSHGHYDHGGGLEPFLNINPNAPVYVSRFAFYPYYNKEEQYIGLPAHLANHPQLVSVAGDHPISENLQLVTLPAHLAENAAGLYRMEQHQLVPDDFCHEQYLLIKEDGKRILISGCSHKGIVPIVAYFQPDVLVGGFHFFHVEDKEVLAQAGDRLNQHPTAYYTCHCTGENQFDLLRSHIRRLHDLACGQTIEL